MIACGCSGESSEFPLPSGKRIDCLNKTRAICSEVEFHRGRIPVAIQRLAEAGESSGCRYPRLIVKDIDHDFARTLVGDNGIEIVLDSSVIEELASCSTKEGDTTQHTGTLRTR
jgi:hypothetical protein